MKKLILALSIILVVMNTNFIAYAGTINQYEQDVIAAAKAQYEYNGRLYKVDPSYINQLQNKLSADHVDLTKSQRDTLLQSVSDYIETGVKDGYLIPVEGQNNEDSTDNPDRNEDEKPSPAEGDDRSADIDDKTNDKGITNDNQEQDNLDSDYTSEENNSGSTKNEFLGGFLDGDTSSGGENNSPDILGQASKPAESMHGETNDIIKNTGFNFNITIIIATGIGVIMVLGMAVTMKNKYFAHSDD